MGGKTNCWMQKRYPQRVPFGTVCAGEHCIPVCSANPVLIFLKDHRIDTMFAFWRTAGLSYVRYTNICSKVLRDCSKPNAYFRNRKGEDRDATFMTFRKWVKGKKGPTAGTSTAIAPPSLARFVGIRSRLPLRFNALEFF